MKLTDAGQTVYECPTDSEVSPSSKNLCLSYIVNVNGTKTCNDCPKPNFLVPSEKNVELCLSQTIKGCRFYNPDGTCKLCYSGVAYDSVKGVCSSAEAVISGCDNLQVIDLTFTCNACKAGFILTSDSRCIKSIPFCSVYAGSTCKACISDHFWNGKICVNNILNCQSLNENGECTSCSS